MTGCLWIEACGASAVSERAMKDYTRQPSPWGTYGFVVRRTIDGRLHHRSFPARADHDRPEVIEQARKDALEYDAELLRVMEASRERRRQERPPKGLSPVSGVQPVLIDTERNGRRYEYRGWGVRRYRDGLTVHRKFWVREYGDRRAWEEACRFLSQLEGIDPDPLIQKYPGPAIWDQVWQQRQANRGAKKG